ncbi:MAG: LysR family transcriptional regulator [Alsobacter sp.]
MDRFDSLTAFVAVAQEGSLSAAARKLGLSLPTMSRRLAELEAHLGVRLLNRSTRSLALTDTGETFLVSAKEILGRMEDAERIAAGDRGTPRGELALSAPIVFGRLHVLPVVTAFLAENPLVDVRLALSDRFVHLLDDHVDAAVRIGDLPDSTLVARRLGAIRRVVCASPDYLAAHGAPKHPEDLTDHACIGFESPGHGRRWTFLRDGAEIVVRPRERLRVNTAEAALDAAMAGAGVTRVLSYQSAGAVRAGRLRVLLEDFEPQPWAVSLVHAGQSPMPRKLRAFIDFAAPVLSERLARLG